MPIPLPLAVSSLQSCIDEWENQATPHAPRSDRGILIIQLRRSGIVDGNVSKNQSPIHILPGQSFGVPIFLTNDSLERTMRQCRVVLVIYHRQSCAFRTLFDWAELSDPRNSLFALLHCGTPRGVSQACFHNPEGICVITCQSRF